MTQTEARQQLELLRRQMCTCEDCERVRITFHEAGCPYRITAFTRVEFRPFVGPLYEQPLAVA